MFKKLKRLHCAVVSVSMTAALLLAAPASPASAGSSKKPSDLPALTSPPPTPRPLDKSRADFSNQPPLDQKAAPKDYSKSFDKEKSKLAKRNARSDVYDNVDGTQTAIFHTSDVNWQDGAGAWHAIDNSLVKERDSWRNASARVTVRLPDVSGGASLAAVSTDDWSIEFGIAGARAGSRAQVSKNKATYADVLPDIDAEEAALLEGVKETVILKRAPTTDGDLRLRFPLTLRGVAVAPAGDGSMIYRTPNGEVVARTPKAVIWDAAQSPASDQGLTLPFALGTEAGQPVLELSVPESFLRDPSRTFPVYVDPTIDAGHATTQFDAFASSASPNTNYNGAAQLDGNRYVNKAGYDTFPTSQQYTYQYFELSPLSGKQILDATWRNYVYAVRGSGFYRMYPISDTWIASDITWNNKPQHRGEFKDGTATTGSTQYQTVTDWVQNWATGTWTSRGISIDSAGLDSGVRFAATEDGTSTNGAIFVTYNTPPTAGQVTAPLDGATLMSDQPSFTGTAGSDAEGTALTYWFRLSTNPDGATGSLLNSGGLSSPSWTPPAGVLVDGTTYYWRMLTGDGNAWVASPVRSFKYDARLGTPAVSPKDNVGPATVNLASGNLVVNTASPSYDTVGGPVGVSFTYNSRAPEQFGLLGTYTSDGNPEFERFVRRDRQIDMNFGSGAPGPGITADNFTITWDGYITVPYEANNWSFGVVHDDDVTVTINNEVYISRPGFTTTPVYGQPKNFLANQTVPITISLQENSGVSYVQLYAAGPWNGIVPASWLSTTPPPLPQGWSMSIDVGGGALQYARAEFSGKNLVLVEPDGITHEYRQQSDRSWLPSDSGDDVVSLSTEPNGATVYVAQGADGIVYTFNGKGQLIRALSAADDKNPAAATFDYDPTTARLKGIIDPVTGRRLDLIYSTDPYSSTNASQCPKNSAAGLTANPPIGMLCQVRYWDGTRTNLYYLGSQVDIRTLARIEDNVVVNPGPSDPGPEVTDFAYDAGRRLAKVRDPLAADIVAAGLRPDDDTTRTLIGYDSSGRASGVTLPAPLPGSARPGHTYGYTSSSQTDVHVAGRAEPNGYVRRVTFDAAGRMTEDRDAAGLKTSTTFDKDDKPTSITDPVGLKSTTVFDYAKRAVEGYGPSPASCFGIAPTEPGWTGERPNGTCTTTPVPVTRTAYDEGIKSLAAEYWTNKNQAGTSVLHATGVGHSTGALSVDWGLGAPTGLSVVDNWSARFTGDIRFPLAGTYAVKLCADDGVRLFLDDDKKIDDWVTTGTKCRTSSTNSSAAGSRKRIRVDYFEDHSPANLTLYWTPPGGTEQVVPGDNLSPRYGLATSTIDADGKKSTVEYSLPEYGLAVAAVTDPAGLNLRTTTTYESPGSGFLRRTSRSLPKGTTTQYAYYAAGATAPGNECGGTAATGMVRSVTEPGGTIRQFVYDAAHRAVGRRATTDPRWSCTSYDKRGRVTTTTDSAGRTSSATYTTPGQVQTTYVDSSGAGRTVTEQMDLLGRPYSYTDEHGTTTRRSFNQAGQVTGVYRTFAGGIEQSLITYSYDPHGRLSSSTEALSGGSRTTTYVYDQFGRLETTTRPNGVSSSSTYDSKSGVVSAISHDKGATPLSSWRYTRTAGGRIANEETTGRVRNFTYDTAGRLTKTAEGATTRNYAYDANSNRCARAATCVAPTYAYDSADRISSSPAYATYAYDPHGNMTLATPRTPTTNENLDETFALDPAAPSVFDVKAGAAGTLSAALDWTGATTTYRSQTSTGTVAPSSQASTAALLTTPSYLKADISWSRGTYANSTAIAGTLPASGSTTRTFTADAPGTITSTVNWSPSTSSGGWNGNVANLGTEERAIAVSANGTISASLSWPTGTPNPNLDLELVDSSGTVVKSSTQLTGNSESLSYAVTSVGSYPDARSYRLRVKAVGTGSSFTLSGTWPVTANIDLELYNASNVKVAEAAGTGAKPETVAYPVSSGATGTYTLKVVSRDYSAPISGTSSNPQLGFADVALRVVSPTGTEVARSSSSNGTAEVAYATPGSGTYAIEVVNQSADRSIPSYTMPWSTTPQLTTFWNAAGLSYGQTAQRVVTAGGEGYLTASATWTQGVGEENRGSQGFSLAPGESRSVSLPVDAAGTINANVDWTKATTAGSWSGNVANLGTADRSITVSANGTVSGSVTWPAATPNPNLDLELLDSAGNVVTSSTQLTGNSESLSHNVTTVGAYPATRTYKLRVKAVGTGSSYNLSGTWPVTANVDLELYNPSNTKVAETTGASAKPETLSYGVADSATGTYTLKAISRDFTASSVNVGAVYPKKQFAQASLTLINQSGAPLASTSESDGSSTVTFKVPAAGDYTVSFTNGSPTVLVPSMDSTVRVPDTATSNATLALKDAAGNVVVQDTSGARPKTLTTSVAPGNYKLVVSADGPGPARLTSTYPGTTAPKQQITYDAHDHAVSVDDGATTVYETLAPGGRVIRRVARDNNTQAVLEDVLYGYDGTGDTPSYSKSGNTVTTYLQAGGVSVIYTGTEAAWALWNGHGDIIGTTDASGAFTANPSTDEFGIGDAPASRLGWLGGAQRFRVGGSTALMRMGVRLYDPTVGRFHQADPVEGGSCNDYDYVCGDPVNSVDLAGFKKFGPIPDGDLDGITTDDPPGSQIIEPVVQAVIYVACWMWSHRGDSARNFRKRLGGRKGDGCEAHHIVALNDWRAAESRQILAQNGVGWNSYANGALISKKGHQALHTKAYHYGVRDRLRPHWYGGAKAVATVLRQIGAELRARYPCGQGR